MSMQAQAGTGAAPGGTRVVIVDDHAIFRSGLKADLDPGILVVGEAGAENITGFPFGPEHNIIKG